MEAVSVFGRCAVGGGRGGVSGGCSSRFHTLASRTPSVLVVWSSTSEGLDTLRIPALAGAVGMRGYSSYEVAGTVGIQPLDGAFGVPYQAAEPRDERTTSGSR